MAIIGGKYDTYRHIHLLLKILTNTKNTDTRPIARISRKRVTWMLKVFACITV